MELGPLVLAGVEKIPERLRPGANISKVQLTTIMGSEVRCLISQKSVLVLR